MRHGIDEQFGGFRGRISNDLVIDPLSEKGLILNARILWTFSRVYEVYGEQQFLDVARRAYEYIAEHFRDVEHGGVYWMVDYQGAPSDTKKQQVFSTADDNQGAVTIHVLQGERDVASGNKSLGQFNLEGIPPSPRGMPQIEVTFDIDANGILHVSAKDKATGKENKITVKANSGLSEDEIKRMVKDAEAHAEEDRQARELVDARNQADSAVHMVKKALAEHGDKIAADEKSKIEAALKATEEAMKDNDKDAIEARTRELTQVSQKLGEQMYAQAGAGAPGRRAPASAQGRQCQEAGRRSRRTKISTWLTMMIGTMLLARMTSST
jgi:uncharacterized protein YyaL (SSP411 family)